MVADLGCLGCAFKSDKYSSPFVMQSCRTSCMRRRILFVRQSSFTRPDASRDSCGVMRSCEGEGVASSPLHPKLKFCRQRARLSRICQKNARTTNQHRAGATRENFWAAESRKSRVAPARFQGFARGEFRTCSRGNSLRTRSIFEPKVKTWKLQGCRRHFLPSSLGELGPQHYFDRYAETATGKTLGWNDPADSLGAEKRPNRGRSSPFRCFARAQSACRSICKAMLL